jgi:hypothetical protein
MDNNLVELQPVEGNEPPDPFAGGAGLTEQPYEGLGETVRPVRVALIPYFLFSIFVAQTRMITHIYRTA